MNAIINGISSITIAVSIHGKYFSLACPRAVSAYLLNSLLYLKNRNPITMNEKAIRDIIRNCPNSIHAVAIILPIKFINPRTMNIIPAILTIFSWKMNAANMMRGCWILGFSFKKKKKNEQTKKNV